VTQTKRPTRKTGAAARPRDQAGVALLRLAGVKKEAPAGPRRPEPAVSSLRLEPAGLSPRRPAPGASGPQLEPAEPSPRLEPAEPSPRLELAGPSRRLEPVGLSRRLEPAARAPARLGRPAWATHGRPSRTAAVCRAQT
jgi:hypothetical protein